MKRRSVLSAWALSGVPARALGTPAGEATEPTPSERGVMADVAQAYMQKFDVPALSVAVGCAGRLAPTALCVRRREVIGGAQDGAEEDRRSKDSRTCPRQAIVDCS